MRPRPAVISVLLVCALASRAWGAPAVVRVFEAQAHEGPDVNSPVLHVFPEDAKLSVSEEATDGWRRVRLPDGRTGFVREDQIAVAAPPPVQPLPHRSPPAVGAQPDAPPAAIRVRDLDHLSSLAQDDAVVGHRAGALVVRRNAAFGIMLGAIAAGAALGIAGVTVLADERCAEFGAESVCVREANWGAITGGFLLAGSGVLLWLFMKPRRSEVVDVIDAWNARHSDQPFVYVR